MGCGGSKAASGEVATKNPAHPGGPAGAGVTQGSMSAAEMLTAAALKSKRRGNVIAERQDVTEEYVPRVVAKDEHARVLISTALRDNILFASLGQAEILEMIDAMSPVEFPAGAEVIKQGQWDDLAACCGG